jgi:hypothetical protein
MICCTFCNFLQVVPPLADQMMSSARLAVLFFSFSFFLSSLSSLALGDAAPVLAVSVGSSGAFTVTLDGTAWFNSAPPSVCVQGTSAPLHFVSQSQASGSDALGAWTGISMLWTAPQGQRVQHIFKQYAARPAVAVLTAVFPDGLDTSGCGINTQLSTRFPVLDAQAAMASTLSFVSWKDVVLSTTQAVRGLDNLKRDQLDCGPVVASLPGDAMGRSLVWSTLDRHKIVVQSVSGPSSSGAVSSLWSEERQDQLACLSTTCYDDQKPSGNYITQRVEGYMPQAGAVVTAPDGTTVTTIPIKYQTDRQADRQRNEYDILEEERKGWGFHMYFLFPLFFTPSFAYSAQENDNVVYDASGSPYGPFLFIQRQFLRRER